ncbi:MAG: signal recognition particle protein [Emcibacter sp.]|nr:signal recognition particle protein [Emcibacter sp.]
MFDSLSDKLGGIFDKLKRRGALSEAHVDEAMREVRLALLEADVALPVVKNFIAKVKEKAIGQEVVKSVTPGQMVVKIVNDQMVEMLGGDAKTIDLNAPSPVPMLMVGLQGSGKTTSTAKIAKRLKNKERKKVLMASLDVQRPAAMEQLEILGKQIDVPTLPIIPGQTPVDIAKRAITAAKLQGFDVVMLDTAGRLHVDEEMMVQLEKIKEKLSPTEILFVANAATGQDAVKAAAEFDRRLTMTGSILTMLDSNTRAGAAISIREVTGKPLKFEGIGERLDDLQLFDARSMADRILGMGDAINLVKKAQEYISDEEAKELEEKVHKASFTYEDYLKQMQAVRKMGSIKGLLKMLPGASKMPNLDQSEGEFSKIESIILSMTTRERQEKDELSISRTKRIARGSGRTVGDVNKLKKSFKRSKQLFKKAPNKKMLEKMMRG